MAEEKREFTITKEKEYKKDRFEGTLHIFENGRVIDVAEDVLTQFYWTSVGDLVFLQDYSINYIRGELCVLRKNGVKKIDEDVSIFAKAMDNSMPLLPGMIDEYYRH